jgi:hypothetical protein
MRRFCQIVGFPIRAILYGLLFLLLLPIGLVNGWDTELELGIYHMNQWLFQKESK